MGCPKGTRSKGLATAGRAGDIKKSSTMRNRLLSKKERVGKYVTKQEFMKESLARHLAAAELSIAAACGVASTSAAAASGDASAAAAAPPAAAAVVHAPAAPPAYKAEAKAYVSKLKSKMGVQYAQPLVGQLKYEGKVGGQRPPKKYKNGGKPRVVAGEAGAGVIDESRKIGHLMKPLKGDEIDFATIVDTSSKLPGYAQGNRSLANKKKKNKRKNSLAARG
mmetsp:Transcript_2080/g.4671  ORF Transcript_2080/g.4671 Transcript_2080/m.4671 type:complete len:222 (+) Transcript_2080:289-954(+)